MIEEHLILHLNLRKSFESQSSMDNSITSNSGLGETSWEVRSLTNLRNVVQSKDSKTNLKAVPKMTKNLFTALWKGVYDIFQAEPDDQVSCTTIYIEKYTGRSSN